MRIYSNNCFCREKYAMPLQGKEEEDMTTKDENRILEQISRILVREKQITPEEQLRMLELIRKR